MKYLKVLTTDLAILALLWAINQSTVVTDVGKNQMRYMLLREYPFPPANPLGYRSTTMNDTEGN